MRIQCRNWIQFVKLWKYSCLIATNSIISTKSRMNVNTRARTYQTPIGLSVTSVVSVAFCIGFGSSLTVSPDIRMAWRSFRSRNPKCPIRAPPFDHELVSSSRPKCCEEMYWNPRGRLEGQNHASKVHFRPNECRNRSFAESCQHSRSSWSHH